MTTQSEKDRQALIDETELKLAFYEHTEETRKFNEEKFAVKLVEKIVFGLVGILLAAIMTALISLILVK